jgi:superfamily II DNA helicase RecQ
MHGKVRQKRKKEKPYAAVLEWCFVHAYMHTPCAQHASISSTCHADAHEPPSPLPTQAGVSADARKPPAALPSQALATPASPAADAGGLLAQVLRQGGAHSEARESPAALPSQALATPASPAADAGSILKRVWGFGTLKSAQQEVVDFITARTASSPDLICNFPTGFGKTVCYCLPALHERVRVLVVSPLCSLICDQTEKLNARAGARVALNLSGMGPPEDAQLAAGACGHGRLLFTTPERLQGEEFAACLADAHARDPLAYIVLDEAHLVVEQGYTFRPDYLRLGSLRAAFPGVPIYCFSATCTAYVRQDLQALLRLRTPRHFAVPDARDNLHLCVHHTRKGARQCACGDAACMWPVYAHGPDAAGPCVARCVRGLAPGEALVFAATVREVEALHAHLQQRMPTAGVGLYHGKLPDEERLQTQARFVGGELDVLVATMASFGTGVDMPRVSRVVICGVPSSVHTLVQTVGRGGRGAVNSARPYHVDVFVTEAQARTFVLHAMLFACLNAHRSLTSAYATI